MGAVWSNAGYLLTAGVTVQVSRLLGFSLQQAAAAFAPSVLALTGGFAITSLPGYGALPFWVQLAAFVIVTPIVLLGIVTIRRARQLIPNLLGAMPILRGREGPVIAILDALEKRRPNFTGLRRKAASHKDGPG
jgi:hypothetical protein